MMGSYLDSGIGKLGSLTMHVLTGDGWAAITVRGVVLAMAGTYVALMILGAFFTDSIIFRPPLPGYRDDASVLKLTSADGARISAIYFPNDNARFTLLFSHGNAEDIGYDLPFLEAIRDAGFAVFAYDYQGYGTSEGKPSEGHLYEDSQAAYNYLINDLHVPPVRIIAWGRSLGAAAAVDLASRRPVAGLIMESAFTSAFRVLTRIPLPFDKFSNLTKIRNVRCPVLVIHGKRDEIISFHHGQKLFAAANEPKMCFWVENAGHNDIVMVAGGRYFEELLRFAELVHHSKACR
jgi:pimeloyl-ACP methyl ester carboxylesterase